jgi:hypothetical protein
LRAERKALEVEAPSKEALAMRTLALGLLVVLSTVSCTRAKEPPPADVPATPSVSVAVSASAAPSVAPSAPPSAAVASAVPAAVSREIAFVDVDWSGCLGSCKPRKLTLDRAGKLVSTVFELGKGAAAPKQATGVFRLDEKGRSGFFADAEALRKAKPSCPSGPTDIVYVTVQFRDENEQTIFQTHFPETAPCTPALRAFVNGLAAAAK